MFLAFDKVRWTVFCIFSDVIVVSRDCYVKFCFFQCGSGNAMESHPFLFITATVSSLATGSICCYNSNDASDKWNCNYWLLSKFYQINITVPLLELVGNFCYTTLVARATVEISDNGCMSRNKGVMPPQMDCTQKRKRWILDDHGPSLIWRYSKDLIRWINMWSCMGTREQFHVYNT